MRHERDGRRILRRLAWVPSISFLILTSIAGSSLVQHSAHVDFLSFWAAGRVVLEGNPSAAYDITAHRAVETTVQSGTGVDLLHVYAYPNPGSNQAPIFLGVASVGVNRPDVGALYGSRYNDAGYTLTVDRAAAGLAPGVYNVVVHSHSTVTGAFNNVALVRVTLQ